MTVQAEVISEKKYNEKTSLFQAIISRLLDPVTVQLTVMRVEF